MWVDAVLLALWLKQSCLTSDFCSFPLAPTFTPNQRRHLLLIAHINGDPLPVENTVSQSGLQRGLYIQRISTLPPRSRRACFHAARSSSVMCSNIASRACASSIRFRFLIVMRIVNSHCSSLDFSFFFFFPYSILPLTPSPVQLLLLLQLLLRQRLLRSKLIFMNSLHLRNGLAKTTDKTGERENP